MALVQTTRLVYDSAQETTLKRDVDESMLRLEPDAAPLWVLTNAAKKRAPTIAPKFEWFEDAEAPLWGQVNNGTDYASNATQIIVVDSTLFAVNDVVIVPAAAGAGVSRLDELILVTAVTLGTQTLTVQRALGGASTGNTITATGSLRILGQSAVEGGGVPTVRSTMKVPKFSYTQYFRTPIQTSEIMEATEAYAVPEGERMYQRAVSLVRHRSEIEAAGLWGQVSTTYTASGGIQSTTNGVKAVIATNITDAGTTLTYTSMLHFGEMGFRYGEKEKLCMAGPAILSAFDYWSANKLLTNVSDTVFGVAIKKIVSNHGTYMIANNFRMEAGIAGAAGFNNQLYLIDLPSVTYRYLAGNGKNLNTKLYENIVQSGVAATVDEYRSMVGWLVRHEQKFARIYNATSFA